MANFKTAKNIASNRTEYSKIFSGFRGVDFSSDHTEVNDSRFAYLVNMYKDYRSGQGDAVETIPGFRKLLNSFGAEIYGIHVGLGKMFVHTGTTLYYVADVDENNSVTMIEEPVPEALMNAQKSTSFCFDNNLYILDGANFLRIDSDINITKIVDEAYVPRTHISIDPGAQYDSNAEDYGEGEECEQRNILTPLYKNTFLANGEVKEFTTKFQNTITVNGVECTGKFENLSNDDNALFPSNMIGAFTGTEIYQYDVLLPWRTASGVPKGYPNAIKTIWADGRVELVNPPPAPENNTWDPTKKAFDYTDEQIKNGEIPENYTWPHAYASGYAGIEIVAEKRTKAITGIAPVDGDAASIITRCTIATIFDNRIFLSGNPRYPKHIFWSGIVKETGRPDPTYFGILNYDQEGVSDAPVVAMLPVADTLMVLKRDAEGEGSVLFHTPSSTGDNVYARTYPSAQGLSGVGCLGASINFRDDPIFLSKYGVEAMGQLSVRYERAIEHRSSLVDAKLLNCDLSKASVAEWEGYLLVLCEGKIFMADSRQMFTHESGVTQYEWYYLEDIGVYAGQYNEFVFAEMPPDITREEILELTNGIEIQEASAVIGEEGTVENLIGQTANLQGNRINLAKTADGRNLFYITLAMRDEHGNENGEKVRYYVEQTEKKIGGKFDPAIMLKVVGSDIFFGTRGGVLCKFNFDKRDKETGMIPNEYYDFDGRTIFCGVATKMDNCGIPHLTKNTVKRSTVIKTRTFKHSAAKVKVRTNKKAFRQVGRIINGRATFDDMDFESFSFSTDDKSLYSINEREKKWVEKQYFIYSDEFRRPFAIHYLAYRYNVAGQYKE